MRKANGRLRRAKAKAKELLNPNWRYASIEIIGRTPLIIHRYQEQGCIRSHHNPNKHKASTTMKNETEVLDSVTETEKKAKGNGKRDWGAKHFNPRGKKEFQNQWLQVPALNQKYANIELVGITDLGVRCWSQKAEYMLPGNPNNDPKKPKGPKPPRIPEVEMGEGLYWLDDHGQLVDPPQEFTDKTFAKGRFGFKSNAFRMAVISVCSSLEGVTKVQTRQIFNTLDNYVHILGPPPVLHTDPVKIGKGSAQLRYRGFFHDWRVILRVRYNANVTSLETLVHLLQNAGAYVGVGEWRPEHNGTFGTFEVGRVTEMASGK